MITKNKTVITNGAKAIIDTLKLLGTDTIFGYPGGIVLNLYDELYKQNEIKHILVRHEQSAVHAAEGYARATGKCGVVLVTSGPGATNTVSGLVNAYLDGYPLIVLTGQVSENLIGKNAFQEANICDITKSCTKRVFQIKNAKDIQNTLIQAYQTAMSGKKGPVVVDLIKDIFNQETEINSIIDLSYSKNICADEQRIKEVCLLLKSSKSPVILVGGGVTHANAYKEVEQFAKENNIPVVSSMMGLGNFSQNDEKYFGMVGIFGDKSANEICKNSDLIISLGCRFNDRVNCMFTDDELKNKIIQIDINPEEISNFITPKYSIIGDIKEVLTGMLKYNDVINFSKWCEDAQKYKNLNQKSQKMTNMMHSFEVIKALDKFTKDKDVIFTSEVGQHQLFAVKNLTLNNNRKILLSGGSGTMGFGLPSAIGACIANPDKTVICIAGDGSIQMSIGELALCKDYNLNLKIIILNNGYLGMVRYLQDKNCHGHYSQTRISNPDYIKLAQSYGIKACSLTSVNDIEKALNQAFSTNEPYIINFEVEPKEEL